MELSFPAQASCSCCRAGASRDCCLQRRLAQLHASSGSAFCWQAEAACRRCCHASQAIDIKRGAPANMLQAGREADDVAQRMQPALILCGRLQAAGWLAGRPAGRQARRLAAQGTWPSFHPPAPRAG